MGNDNQIHYYHQYFAVFFQYKEENINLHISTIGNEKDFIINKLEIGVVNHI